jgi:glycosyltransferase involved in cell wall biosynthesis
MPSLLQEVDVAALPTHYNEGLPRFLVESASSGLPIVATDIPACRAIVRDGENGFIIAPRNAKALANAIDTLIADAALRSRMSQASRSIAVNEFDEKQVLMEWLALYQELAPLSEFQ